MGRVWPRHGLMVAGRSRGRLTPCITRFTVDCSWIAELKNVPELYNIEMGYDMPVPGLTFTTQEEWEAWLEANCEASSAVWLRLARKSSGKTTITYAQALESALCFGWIDGQKQAESEQFWLQRFSRRTANSIWSKINTEKAQALVESGRMRPNGLREIARAKRDGRWNRAYTSPSNSAVPTDLQVALDANKKAKAFFDELDRQNRYAILFRIQNAKKAETRARKIAQFVEMLSNGETLHP